MCYLPFVSRKARKDRKEKNKTLFLLHYFVEKKRMSEKSHFTFWTISSIIVANDIYTGAKALILFKSIFIGQ